MTSINPSPPERAASVGTLLKNSRKRAPGALVPRGIIRGAQGLRVQLPNGLHAPRRRPTSVLTTRKRCSTVSRTEGRRYAGGELPRRIISSKSFERAHEGSSRLGVGICEPRKNTLSVLALPWLNRPD